MNTERREFLELVETHGSAIWSVLRRMCGNAADADDVFQETALRVWRKFGDKPILRNPRGWLMTIAYRASIDHQTRRKSHDVLIDAPDARLPSPDEQAEHTEECARLNATIDTLPAQYREVVVLHYTGGLTLQQTAEAMNISLGTVKSRLNTALERLRSVMQ